MTQDSKDAKLIAVNSSNKSKHEGNRVDKSKKVIKKKENVAAELMTRVIIRQLPPTMTEEQFLEDVSPLPEYSEFYYVNGDLSLGEFAFSRAYFKFKNFDELLVFKDKFDNYVFMDAKGNEFPAIVEYSPLQKMPRRCSESKQAKQDLKANTIENDPEYIAFIEDLKNATTTSPPPYSADALLEEIENNKLSKDNDTKLTPLLEFLSKKREDKIKMKEDKKRKKDEAKKKKIDEKKLNKAKEQQQQQAKRKAAKSPEEKPKQEATYVIKVNTEESRAKPAPKGAAPASALQEGKDAKIGSSSGEKGVKEKDPGGGGSSTSKPTRIRNKDRPAREIYRPGAKQKAPVQPPPPASTSKPEATAATSGKPLKTAAASEGEKKAPDANANTTTAKGNNNQSKFKNRVFTRTKN